jgi:hypothetical protein
MIFSEPINLSPLLSRLRRLAPMRTDVTPGERPLVRAEMDLVARLLPGIEVRPFSLFGRLERFLLVGFNYERSPASRRALVSALAGLDALLLSLPWVEDLAGTCVMYGVKP